MFNINFELWYRSINVQLGTVKHIVIKSKGSDQKLSSNLMNLKQVLKEILQMILLVKMGGCL